MSSKKIIAQAMCVALGAYSYDDLKPEAQERAQTLGDKFLSALKEAGYMVLTLEMCKAISAENPDYDCCSGHHCGCRGASTQDRAIWELRQLIAAQEEDDVSSI